MHPRITMCCTASDPASIGRASVLPCVTRLQTMPSCSGGVRCCHVPHSSGLCLPAGGGGGGSDSATWLRTLPPCLGGLRCYHVPHGSEPYLPAREGGSNIVTYPTTLRGLQVLRIKKELAAMACSKAHMFPRHARALSRSLQDMRADGIIMTCKPCGQAL
jgi:hypothetical protein